MNKVLKEFISQKTIPFIDDILIKGCGEEEKDEILNERGCKKFISSHIEDIEKKSLKTRDGQLDTISAGIKFWSSGDSGDRISLSKHKKEVESKKSERDGEIKELQEYYRGTNISRSLCILLNLD